MTWFPSVSEDIVVSFSVASTQMLTIRIPCINDCSYIATPSKVVTHMAE